MNYKLVKKIVFLFAISFAGMLYAQKTSKKFTENFKVNKDVEVAINASNTEINVNTWNKNEVQVNAFIEIEGVSKKEAEKYFEKWNFEALGNKSKVKITAKGSNSHHFQNDFVFFNNHDFVMPDVEMPNLDSILENVNFDFHFDHDAIFEGLDSIDELFKKDGEYSFYWKDEDNEIKINTKKEWETFKKTKEYRKLKAKKKKENATMKIKVREGFIKSKKEMVEKLKKAKLNQKLNQAKMKKNLEKSKEHLKKMKFRFSSDKGEMMINGKKVKINKRLEIKVPKKATFDLNMRHCKVKLPNTVASGSVDYGTFDANNLSGGDLRISYSPVNINNLNAYTLKLNNVTDAKIASVTNSTLSNDSSGVEIFKINENVNVSSKFGELTVVNINPEFNDLQFFLEYSNASIPLLNLITNFEVAAKETRFVFAKNNKKNKLVMLLEKTPSVKKATITSAKKTQNAIKLAANYSVVRVEN